MDKICILGDSHTVYFSYGVRNGLYYPFEVDVCTVSAATAAGLRNDDSFTQAAVRFKEFLRDKEKTSLILFQLGEVDCGILVWLRSKKYGTSLNEEMDKSISAYVDFVQELQAEGFSNIGITSPTLPTINDKDHAGVVISERRKKVSASQHERTETTLIFSEKLKERFERLGVFYIDASSGFIDEVGRLCNVKFRNKNAKDHHMDNELASVVWATRVRGVAKSIFNKCPPYSFKGVALKDTYLKKLPMHSRNLSDESKLFIPKGSLISFNNYDSNKFSFFESVCIEGSPVDEGFNFIYPPHWNLSKPANNASIGHSLNL
ncbi:hypothetical protein [Halomonas sp. 3A7M]|uniref:hypothetical protein n=1 Tax=Halomonas sp. 3A7M TaxID=2742616 RepID=UPI0018683BC2|nr:hypothetical protein [Halomonas sp. 3A7M]